MLSKNTVKYIRSLELKKFRNEYGSFVAEGNKLVADMLPAFDCEILLAKTSWLATQGDIRTEELLLVEDDEIRKVSFLKNPQEVLAVFRQPKWLLEEATPATHLILALDNIQDPGNLGTIIRIADWFGIEHVVCNTDTVDVFSPKVIQATMGALSRVKVHYTDLDSYLQVQAAQAILIYGTFLNGDNIYEKKLSTTGILVMGNEGNGIRPETESLIKEKLYIPNYPMERETSESLNVAVATAITCAEFRRRSGNAV